jgi:hypothetical protein
LASFSPRGEISALPFVLAPVDVWLTWLWKFAPGKALVKRFFQLSKTQSRALLIV